MKIEVDDKELVQQIAERIINHWDSSLKNDCIEYTGIGKMFESKIDKIIADNKEKIINDATKLCADSIQKDINLRATGADVDK